MAYQNVNIPNRSDLKWALDDFERLKAQGIEKMAKAEKMNRGVSSKTKRGGGVELKLPAGVHSFDSHGNVFASLPELSRVSPKFYSMDELKAALEAGTLTTMNAEDLTSLETLVNK